MTTVYTSTPDGCARNTRHHRLYLDACPERSNPPSPNHQFRAAHSFARPKTKQNKLRSHSLPRRSPLLFPPVPAADEAAHYEALHRKYAPRLVAVYMKLGGFYYKSGQKMAANMGGFVPKYYQDICQPFLNDIPVRHFPAQFPPF